MGYMDSYKSWLDGACFDEQTKEELRNISGDEREIEDRFHTSLAFGTGGMRGVLGAGTNRMNIYTVSKAAQGLANYIIKHGGGLLSNGVVIAHDSRRMSAQFSERAALVLNGNGIKTYIFDELRPTPELSFAVRRLGCVAGMMITASHNPKEYNGLKVYWSDGGQVVYPMDEAIINEVNGILDYDLIKTVERKAAAEDGLFCVLSGDIDDAYMACVKGTALNPELSRSKGGNISIVYTPFNGAGNKLVRRALSESGFSCVHVVPEQEMPDPDFTTIDYPNPEDPKAFTYALKLAKEVGADLVIGTDPDSDRVGCMALHNGDYVFLTGNMIGTLMAEYILSQMKEKGVLPANGALISTIVSSRLARTIAQAYGLHYEDVLTGFKYIAEKIACYESEGNYEFVFGFEESIGFMPGSYTRDKDAVAASLVLCEMALYFKEQGMTLCDALYALYDKYGNYCEKTESIVLKGLDGSARIKNIMSALRSNPPESVGGVKVAEIMDCKKGERLDMATGTVSPVDLPVSDVFYCALEGDNWFCARPSGTEPKIKIYCGVKCTSREGAQDKLKDLLEAVMHIIASK